MLSRWDTSANRTPATRPTVSTARGVVSGSVSRSPRSVASTRSITSARARHAKPLGAASVGSVRSATTTKSRRSVAASVASKSTAGLGVKGGAHKKKKKKKQKVTKRKASSGTLKSILAKPGPVAKQREALIKALQKGRATGSLLGDSQRVSSEATPQPMLSSPVVRGPRAGSVSPYGAASVGTRTRGVSPGAASRRKKAATKKSSTAQKMAEQLFAATTDTALGAEVQILRAALATLTNTVVEEVDRLRQENSSLKAALHASLEATHALAADAREDARQALRKVDRIAEDETTWRESMAEMRATVIAVKENSAPLMAQVDALRTEVHKLEKDLLQRFKGISEERQSRRGHIDAVIDGLRSRFTDADDTMDRHRRELQAADRRRLEDMELVERAVAAVQEQVRRLNERVNQGFRDLATDVRRLSAAGRRVGVEISEAKAEAASAKATILAAGQESSHRFDSVSQVLRALTNAVSAAPAESASSQRGGFHTRTHVEAVAPPVPPRSGLVYDSHGRQS